MTHLPLFRVRSRSNGIRCKFVYITTYWFHQKSSITHTSHIQVDIGFDNRFPNRHLSLFISRMNLTCCDKRDCWYCVSQAITRPLAGHQSANPSQHNARVIGHLMMLCPHTWSANPARYIYALAVLCMAYQQKRAAIIAVVNLLWPCGAIWWHRSGSNLPQVVVCWQH